MTSEIRVNKIENRSGLGTVTFADTGVDLAGIVTATTFSGSGASLTDLPAGNVTGTLPAISGANLTNLTAANLSGALPAISAANLTNVPAANITGTLPAISAANLTNIPAANVTGTLPALTAANLTNIPAANLVGVCTSGLTKTGGFGKLVQVVTSYYASQHSTTSSSAQDTGHTLVITPTSNDNKIIIMNQTSGGNSASGRSWKLYLKKTIGGSETSAAYMQLGDSSQNSSFAFSHVLYWVHTSPGTAEITYKTQHSTDGSGTAYYGYSGSYMVAWEVSS